MDYFNYKNGRLFAENVDVEKIAAERRHAGVYLQQGDVS